MNINMGKNTLWTRERFISHIVVPMVMLAVVTVIPFILTGFMTELLTKFLAFALVALSYDLIWGFAGISNFGHAMFFGLGAYSFGLILTHVSIPGATYIAYLTAIIVPMITGMFLSFFLFYGKVAGAFFAVITMCLGTAFESIAMAWTSFTGGMNGLYKFATPKLGIPGIWEFEVSGLYAPYYLNCFCLAAILIILRSIMIKRDFGRIISAIKDDEKRASYFGYNVNLYKTVIFMISCGVAGLAGALYVPVGTITPSLLGMSLSIQILVWVAVGGRGSLWGPVVGALAVSTMRELLSGVILNYWLIVLGTFFILVVIFWPRGFAGFVGTIRNAVSRNRSGKYGNAQ